MGCCPVGSRAPRERVILAAIRQQPNDEYREVGGNSVIIKLSHKLGPNSLGSAEPLIKVLEKLERNGKIVIRRDGSHITYIGIRRGNSKKTAPKEKAGATVADTAMASDVEAMTELVVEQLRGRIGPSIARQELLRIIREVVVGLHPDKPRSSTEILVTHVISKLVDDEWLTAQTKSPTPACYDLCLSKLTSSAPSPGMERSAAEGSAQAVELTADQAVKGLLAKIEALRKELNGQREKTAELGTEKAQLEKTIAEKDQLIESLKATNRRQKNTARGNEQTHRAELKRLEKAHQENVARLTAELQEARKGTIDPATAASVHAALRDD